MPRNNKKIVENKPTAVIRFNWRRLNALVGDFNSIIHFNVGR